MQKWIRTGISLLLLLVLVGSVLAQESFTSSDGRVSFTLPDGWQVEEDGTRVIVANNLEGLDIGRQGNSALPGTIVLLVAATANVPEVNSDASIAPADLIDTFLSMTGMEGEIIENSINGYPVVQAQVSTLDTELAGTEAGVIGVGTPNGTVFIILETGDALEDYGAELMQIIESMTSAPANPDLQQSGGGQDIAASLGDTASKMFGDGTVMNYPVSYTAADSDNTRVELTSPEGSIIRHEAIKRFDGVGEEAMSAAVEDAFGDGFIDPTRLTDVFGDGSVLQYQVGPRDYFITFVPFTNTTKLLVVSLSETASEAANQAVLAVAQAIAADMSFVTPGSAPAASSTDSAPAASTGSVLAYNSSASGTLTDSAPEQFFTFNGMQGDVVTITMIADDNNALDSWVWLLTSEGFAGDDLVPLVDNDDAADSSIGSYNSQIKDFELPETGEYTIRATRLSGTGGFTIRLESASAPVQANSAPAESPAEPVRQWASSASATSQFGSDSWSAAQATGEPNTTQCGDFTSAWASASRTGSDSLTVAYDQAVIPTQVSIYQTYNPGSIIEVQLVTESGSVIVVPDSADPLGSTACPGVFVLDITDVTEPVMGVTIVLDQTIGGSWNEIDAVELVGFALDAAPVSSGGAVDAAALLGADAKMAELETGTIIPYPADFVELSVTDTYFSVMDADMTTMYTHYARPPFPINGEGADAVDFIVSMFYSSFPFEPEDVIDVLGDGSILLGFAETNSGAQVAFYVYALNGDLYFLQVEAFTDGSDTPFFPIAPEMLALGQAMVQSILAN